MTDLSLIECLAREATPGPWGLHVSKDTDVISLTKWVSGPHGKGMTGHTLAKMPMPSEHMTQEQINVNVNYMRAMSPDVVLELVGLLRSAGQGDK